jgi:hypothetical protein
MNFGPSLGKESRNMVTNSRVTVPNQVFIGLPWKNVRHRIAASADELAEATDLLERKADGFLMRCRRLASAQDAANEIVKSEAAQVRPILLG